MHRPVPHWAWAGTLLAATLAVVFVTSALYPNDRWTTVSIDPALAYESGQPASTAGNTIISDPPAITSPSEGQIRGVVLLQVQQPELQSFGTIELRFQLQSGTYVRSYNTSDVRMPDRFDTAVIPFDTLSMPNGPVQVTICLGFGTTVGCSTPANYTIANEFNVVAPQPQATVSGSTTLTVHITGVVSYVRFSISLANRTEEQPQFVRLAYAQSSHDQYSVAVDTRDLADGSYTLRVSYLPYWQQTYTVLPMLGVPFQVSNAPPPSTNTNSAPSTNTNTNVDPPANTNTAPSTNTNTATTVISPPTITWPTSDAAYFDVSQFRGQANGAAQVELTLKRNTGANSDRTTDQEVVLTTRVPLTLTTTGGLQFAYALPQPLAPGSYTLTAVALDGQRLSQAATTNFRIKTPTIELATLPGTISGRLALTAKVRGTLSSVDFYASQPNLPAVLLGRAQRVSGSTDWSLSYETTTLSNGAYALFARGRALNGLLIDSTPATVTVRNAAAPSATPTTSPSQEPTPSPSAEQPSIPAPADVPDIPVPEVLQAESDLTLEPPVTQAPVATPAEATADARTSDIPPTDQLAVRDATNVPAGTGTGSFIRLSGTGPANAVLTLFIYSNPIVVTTRTDANGNWSYALDRTLADGQHEVYATITDQTGAIQQRSNPLRFFVAEAQAVSEQDFLQAQSAPARSGDTYLIFYLIIAGLLVALTVVVFLLIRLSHRPTLPTP